MPLLPVLQLALVAAVERPLAPRATVHAEGQPPFHLLPVLLALLVPLGLHAETVGAPPLLPRDELEFEDRERQEVAGVEAVVAFLCIEFYLLGEICDRVLHMFTAHPPRLQHEDEAARRIAHRLLLLLAAPRRATDTRRRGTVKHCRGLCSEEHGGTKERRRSTLRFVEDPTENPTILTLIRISLALDFDLGKALAESFAEEREANDGEPNS